MQIEGCVAFVSGANRGVGACFVEKLLEQGARKVYAGARDIRALGSHDPRMVPVELDITNAEHVARAAAFAEDANLLVNNAGINRLEPALAATDPSAAREEMEVNYFGTLNMIRAFAPSLRLSGGAIINVSSILARIALPSMASLCASKAAALRMTEGVRAELAPHGVRVLSILPGAIDTDMSRDFPPPKIPAAEVVQAVFAALREEGDEVYVGTMAQQIAADLAADRRAIQTILAGGV
ncbi:short-chain dehydrogenase [Paraburkholderia ginsengiterrae]|uniref:Short-chain dehydrogenase n=1 Tax=Paraburkholderia ginsengiterrae TaxID=1462993 RepID=A0A1A9N7I2_9BURK|nr:SDR family NAD(P)-dependent oxidoreductase [Paraburkholderia ginsengiterrae]OAJ54803.1 short-chain dehydrogenase [Paraburkholderia ginsengiterrae]OAJ60989.1 short-chain dehydrogenase [Paraburkholderia ginsengiterrae]